jgi:hypothetical protein
LRYANLTGATLGELLLVDSDLSGAQGLLTCQHYGPSTIDHRTIQRSQRIPRNFLRSCGLPEAIIDPLLTCHAEVSCFLSYSTKDQDFADYLYRDLQERGVRCWFAPHSVKGGKKLHEQIDAGIRASDRLLLILSEASMKSEWVQTEIRKARRREVREKIRLLFPISLVPFQALADWECFDVDTGKDLAIEIREYFIPDFSAWTAHERYREKLTRLLRDLTA